MTAPWRAEIDRGLDANRDRLDSRYIQLATIRADDRPANRTVVFRGFRDGSDQLRFTADARSAKVEQIARNSWAEACWFFPETREQFRLLGRLTQVSDSCNDAVLYAERQAVWRELPDVSRQSFTWPTPGTARAADTAFAMPLPDPMTPATTFALLLLDVVEVDHLELAVSGPHRRRRFNRDLNGAWSAKDINP